MSLSRRLEQQATVAVTRHVAIRSIVLILLGMALDAAHPREWSWRFFDTLTQIGLAYPALFLAALGNRRQRVTVVIALLVFWWIAYAGYPLSAENFDYHSVGVSRDWLSAYGLHGFAAHWQKNANMGAAFDRWFLNLFPGERFTQSFDGAVTLNFVPSIATMILGLLAGEFLQRAERGPARRLVLWGAGMAAVGWGLGYLGICPVVKPLWTPAWVLFSGGMCFFILAVFYLVVDVYGCRRLVFPLIVAGANSLVAYCLSHLYPAFAFRSLLRLVGPRPFQVFGLSYQPFIYGVSVLAGYWLVLFLLYRRRIFVRV